MGQLTTAISHRYLASIGTITVNFALLEHNLATIAWTALGDDISLGHIVTSELSFRRLLDLVGSLCQHRIPGQRLTSVDDLLRRAAQVEQKRNELVHSLWVGGWNRRTRPLRMKVSAKRKRGLVFDAAHVSLTEIKRVAGEIANVAYDAVDVRNQVAQLLSRE